MTRFSDVWIVLSLAVVAGWWNWNNIEPRLSAAMTSMMPVAVQTEVAQAATAGGSENTRTIGAPEQTSSPERQNHWTPEVVGFDCSQAPPGCVIIHGFGPPECGAPLTCWEY